MYSESGKALATRRVEAGETVATPDEHACDVLVVGGGPAGLAAARTASLCGASVTLVDDNPGLGGQIWRGQEQHPTDGEARWWIDEVRNRPITVCTSTRLVARPEPGLAVGEHQGAPVRFRFGKAILCTGARELFLPFPGWTLPGVSGAGGLQALAKAGLPVAGRDIAVAGSGPLLWAVADFLRARGARIVLLAEQAPFSAMLGLVPQLLRSLSRLGQWLGYQTRLLGTPVEFSAWPARAQGSGRLESVTFHTPGGERTVRCDLLACAFGLVPNLEVAAMFGAGFHADGLRTGLLQETSAPGVYAAGETTGIAGVESALIEGRVAGYAASGRVDEARALLAERQRAAQETQSLLRAFALREELKALATPDTLFCRCEDVTCGEALACADARAAKIHTRAGMGACQGRICGAAGRFLRGWAPDHFRPPCAPAAMAALKLPPAP